MMIYFIIYKNKKDKDFKMFTNVIFDKENEAEEFGRKSMKRGFEYKVVEYNKENYERWYDDVECKEELFFYRSVSRID